MSVDGFRGVGVSAVVSADLQQDALATAPVPSVVRVGSLPSSKVAIFSGILSSVMAKSSGFKTADVVSLAVGHGDIQLHQHDVHANARRVILCGGSELHRRRKEPQATREVKRISLS